MKILALDIADITGWKTDTASGSWNFKPKRGESTGMSTVRFKARVAEIIELEKITLVSVERPAGRHAASVISMSKKHGVLEDFCLSNSIEIASYSASEIKKFATGKGNCGKPAMIQACIDKYNYTPIDDNEADAIHLYYLTIDDLGIKTSNNRNSNLNPVRKRRRKKRLKNTS